MRIIVISIMAILVFSCESSDGRYSVKMIDGKSVKFIDGDDMVPLEPDKSENEKTLGGVDADGDEVRDDIELWINEVSDDPLMRDALKQVAKVVRRIHMEEFERQKFIKLVHLQSRLEGCISLRSKNFNHYRKIKSEILERLNDNEKRLKKYMRADINFSGQIVNFNHSVKKNCIKI